MAKVNLRVYVNPSAVEVMIAIKLPDGNFTRLAAVVDTGAEISLLPKDLLNDIAFKELDNGLITIEQAGIAEQTFTAVNAMITIYLEDLAGNRTKDIEIPAWFANTTEPLIGFAGVLDQSTLYVNMRNVREGWIELDDQ